jgi:hypothetical protein
MPVIQFLTFSLFTRVPHCMPVHVHVPTANIMQHERVIEGPDFQYIPEGFPGSYPAGFCGCSSRGKATGARSWPFRSNKSRGQENVYLYIHPPPHTHTHTHTHDPPRWPRDTHLATKVDTKFRRTEGHGVCLFCLSLASIYVRNWVIPKVIVLVEERGKFEKFYDLIETRTRDLLECSIASQASTLQRAPESLLTKASSLFLVSLHSSQGNDVRWTRPILISCCVVSTVSSLQVV